MVLTPPSSIEFYRFETLQLHAGHEPDPLTKSRAVPIYQSTSYTFNSVKVGALIPEPAFIYSRAGNPTVDVFEKRMAALEGGVAAVATASGMAAIALTLTALASAGDNIVTARSTPKTTPGSTEKTKALFVEVIANSDTTLADVSALAAVCVPDEQPCRSIIKLGRWHTSTESLVVDATFSMGGYMVKPISLGADIVVHSATKWINGHGTTIAGVIIDSGNFDWRATDRYPSINGPSSAYHNINMAEEFYPFGFAVHVRADLLRDLGPCLSPMNAFLALQGLETLSLRAQRHCDNAMAVAKYLDAHPRVIQVTYLGLPSHPSHAQALRILRPNAFGGILTLRLDGGFDKVVKVIENLRLISHLANIGDAKTLVIAPFATVQGQLTDEEKASGGVSEDLIRISVGIESVQDIIADFEGAFEVAYA
ncbi:pyridoxal phosphate-dependent transferase [Mycena filopes]|nr:pyridoxal phosphate-dependent transferase [Mycena filopes]